MPSETDASARARSDLPDAAVRAQLDRILGSEVFSRSQQLRRFLSFIVEHRLAGERQSLKESVLAHELYGKGTDFDGGADPVVRVDARRLRDKLREYLRAAIRSGRHLAAEGQLRAGLRTRFRRSHRHGWSGCSPSTARESSGSKFQPRGNGRRRSRGRRSDSGGRADVARTRRTRGGSTSFASLGLVSRSGGTAYVVPGREPCRLRLVGQRRSGPTDIYVKAVGTEALRRLTDTPGVETSPAWSPDGHSIAFVRDGQGVFTMSQLGGAERQVSASGTHVAWAGDSKSVLIRDRERDTGPFGIHQVFLDTLERRRLTQAPVAAGDWRFEVSPDGKTLAFIRYEKPGIADLYVVPMGGGEPRRLSNWNAVLTGLAWTPDGREIVYSVDEPAAGRLWRIDANSASPGRGSPIADIPAAAANPSISRPMPGQPARLAFQTISQDVDLHMMGLQAHLVNDTIESTPFVNSTRIEGSARFSPDGSRVAFMSHRSGGPEMWVAGRDGNGLQQITSLGAPGLMVGAWSPDGARIAFEAAIAGNTDVYLVGTDGGHLRRLTAEPSFDGIPWWSGDGEWIYSASTRAGATPDIWRVSPDGGRPTRLTLTGGFEPRESPDGRDLFDLDRFPLAGRSSRTARLMRAAARRRSGGSGDRACPAVSVVCHRHRDRIHHPRAGLRCDRCVPVQRSAGCPRGPAGISDTGGLPAHDGVARRALGLATKMVRFDSDLMRLDNFR